MKNALVLSGTYKLHGRESGSCYRPIGGYITLSAHVSFPASSVASGKLSAVLMGYTAQISARVSTMLGERGVPTHVLTACYHHAAQEFSTPFQYFSTPSGIRYTQIYLRVSCASHWRHHHKPIGRCMIYLFLRSGLRAPYSISRIAGLPMKQNAAVFHTPPQHQHEQPACHLGSKRSILHRFGPSFHA